ncbi:phosphoenolpyruvate--protein phosphotransferase [Nanchangia anserum]|uniref:Phosphoenolpyruvate-protein phosphotransferase n=1 Tax=Nanchangia anserum TaxID=2692125 RepID=A0A8I0KRT0_9ACTO|nr:phosphoenolpyruvate--protein phosphotransferase [Nanchangia anserum]MBD3689707.1 phosphoenolpyruvate--protein phosphotransferase [Nanchangia anserum]QOX81881.1 phosphoenolpyruvate--protein phosphotransferase [Nanchangia anserum]
MSDFASRDTFGTPVVPGVAYGPVAWVRRPETPSTSAPALAEDQRDAEYERFQEAASVVSQRLAERAKKTIGTASDVLAMTSQLARDKGWQREVRKRIRKEGTPAVQATMAATDTFVALFKEAGGLMAERVTDICDVRDRVIAELEGLPEPGIPVLDHPVVLFADDLAPADTAGLNPDNVLGIATVLGGPTSHTSIIARQLGIPCIVAARDLEQIPHDTMVQLDGRTGRIEMDPDPEAAQEAVAADRTQRELAKSWQGPGRTRDGEPVQLLANIQDGEGARTAAGSQAEGVGLFRTELCFLGAASEPSVDQQADIYRPVFEAFPGRKVVVRTLDAGSDKPVAWASVPDEENPALGVRGLRTSGIDPNQLPHQVDAIAQAAAGREGETWVMAPMVSTVAEAKWFTDMARERGLVAGIMVEVPAVAILAEQFLSIVDFFSIGTNDLTQYTMAADRMNPNLATYTDPWQPGVLALIARTAEAGRKLGKPVGVCGEAAADPLLACVLHGMGITSLSMASSAIGAVGAQLSQVTGDQCREAAQAVIGAGSADDARAEARRVLGA